MHLADFSFILRHLPPPPPVAKPPNLSLCRECAIITADSGLYHVERQPDPRPARGYASRFCAVAGSADVRPPVGTAHGRSWSNPLPTRPGFVRLKDMRTRRPCSQAARKASTATP